MSVESFNSFEEHVGQTESSEQELFSTYLKMQVELASDTLGFMPDDNAFMNWEEKYSNDFGVIATEHPELILAFKEGGDEGRKALAEVQKLLHEKEKHEIPA